MLVMIKYKFQPGPYAAQSLERFVQWTPPEGLVTRNVWMAGSHDGFFLGECDDVGAVLEFTAQYSDVASVEIFPVVDASEGVPRLQRGFDYGAAH